MGIDAFYKCLSLKKVITSYQISDYNGIDSNVKVIKQ